MTRDRGRRRARFASLVVALVVALVVVLGAPAGAATDVALPALTGNAPLAVDPVPAGEVAVVAWSAPVRNRVAFVVENGSDSSVRVARVTAVAERVTGTQATRASTTAVVPGRLAPGERAIGQVAFRPGTIDLAPTLTWQVRSARAASAPDPTRLAVDDLVLSPPRDDTVAQTLDLTLGNPRSRAVRGPFRVQVLCLNEAGRPAVLAAATVKGRSLGAGATRPVTVSLRELCPSHVVGAGARGPR